MPNALTAPANPMPAKMPAPTHAQTVAALRHFDAINKQLRGLLKNPDLGKADIRKSVIDAVTKLVSDRILSPTQAVQQMTSFPDKPFDQKQYLGNMFVQNQQAEMAVLMHHGDYVAPEGPRPTPNPDNHMQDMAEMMQAHYPGQQNA